MEHNCSNSTSINMSLPDFLDSLQQETTLVMIPSLCFLAMLAVTGLVGNSLILVVYSSRFKSNTTNVLLMTIAAFDLVANIGALPVEIYTVLQSWNFQDVALCKTKGFLNSITTIGSLFALVAVAVVRYRKICAPHGWQVSSQQVKIISLAAVILAVLLSIPAVVLYGPRSKPTPCDKILGYECYVADHYKDSVLVKLNNGLYFMLYVFTAIPLTVMYILIGRQAHKRLKKLMGPNLGNQNIIVSTPMAMSRDNLMDLPSVELKPSTGTTDSGKGSMSNCGIEPAELSSSSVLPCSFSQNCEEKKTTSYNDHLNVPCYFDVSKNKHKMVTNDKAEYHIPLDTNTFGQKTMFVPSITVNKISSSLSSLDLEDIPNNYILKDIFHQDGHTVTNNELKRVPKCLRFLKVLFRKETNQQRNVAKRNKNNQRSSGRVTSMLIIITSIYVISYLVFIVLSVFRNFLTHHYESMNRTETAVFQLFFRMFFLNCAANCIIYGLCDPNFRRECLRVIKCGFRTHTI